MLPTRCRICSATGLRPHFTVRCSALDRRKFCGFIQVREQPSAEALRTLYSDGYFQRGKYGDDFAQRKEGERRLDWLARGGVAPGGRVLDAGCASGEFLALAGARDEMWGLDVSPYATEIARANNPGCAARIFTGFVEEQRFWPASFDAIVMWEAIEHVRDRKTVLQRPLVHLRPGGALLLSTPDLGAPDSSAARAPMRLHDAARTPRLLQPALAPRPPLARARAPHRRIGGQRQVGEHRVHRSQARAHLSRCHPAATDRAGANSMRSARAIVPTADARYVLIHKEL